MRATLLSTAAAALALSGAASAATTVGFSSDADFTANAFFTKSFGGNVRWGNGQANGDWEYAVVNAADVPIGPSGQLVWGGNADHQYTFDYDGTSQAQLVLENAGVIGDTGLQPVAGGAGINALAVRARTGAGNVASLADIVVSFVVGGAESLGSLVGDADAEYVMLIDPRLASGFQVSGPATLTDGNGSVPMYGFKVGATTIPVPPAAWLFGSALVLLGRARRRAAA